jgi:hypothetical protein
MSRRAIGGGHARIAKGQISADLRLEIGHSCAKAFRHHIRRFFGWVSPDRRQAMTGKGQFLPFERRSDDGGLGIESGRQ